MLLGAERTTECTRYCAHQNGPGWDTRLTPFCFFEHQTAYRDRDVFQRIQRDSDWTNTNRSELAKLSPLVPHGTA